MSHSKSASATPLHCLITSMINHTVSIQFLFHDNEDWILKLYWSLPFNWQMWIYSSWTTN